MVERRIIMNHQVVEEARSDIQFGDKLYIVVRADLLPGQQLAQSVHAAFQFSKEHPNIAINWMKKSNFICVLQIKNESELANLAVKTIKLNLAHSEFREPDYNNSLTAIAIEPGQKTKELVKNLRLALS